MTTYVNGNPVSGTPEEIARLLELMTPQTISTTMEDEEVPNDTNHWGTITHGWTRYGAFGPITCCAMLY